MVNKEKIVLEYLAGISQNKFSGIISLNFQAGELERIKKTNSFSGVNGFNVDRPLDQVFQKIKNWRRDKIFGTITIGFFLGAVVYFNEEEIIGINQLKLKGCYV